MNKEIENIIKKNLPEERTEKKSHTPNCLRGTDKYNHAYCEISVEDEGFNQALSQINPSLIADEVLKITKCDCCDEKDEHIFKDDRSTTRISRPCSGCGKHQTIAGALLKSKEWEKWYKYASENMLFDVDETLTVDAMSDEHWNSFMKFLNDEILKVVVEIAINWAKERREMIDNHEYCKNEGERWENGYDCAMYDILQLLSEHLSPNKENKNNG